MSVQFENLSIDTNFWGISCESEKLYLKPFSAVITGGSALALWIRYLETLHAEEEKTKLKFSPETLSLAKSVADWDMHSS
jgi:hypothetical protein